MFQSNAASNWGKRGQERKKEKEIKQQTSASLIHMAYAGKYIFCRYSKDCDEEGGKKNGEGGKHIFQFQRSCSGGS